MTLLPQRVRQTLSLAVLVATLSACGTTNVNYVTGESQRGAYTWAQERQLGAQSDQQIVAQFGIYDDAALSAYVTDVAQRTLQTSAYTAETTPAEIRNSPFTFRVLDSPVVNAFALPGGYVYVTRGLLAYLNNEAQLSVVLGHEIGHVLARHSSRQAQRAQLGQFGVLGAAVLGGIVGGGQVANGIAQYGSQGAQLLLLSYGRDAEREADQAGVAYAGFAGYDAAQAASFFRSLKRLSAESGQEIPNFLSTHPDPGEREQTIRQLAAAGQNGSTVDAQDFLRQIDNIVLGEDPRQGFSEGSTFYHPELRFAFDFPRGWVVQNSPQAVQISEPNGGAAIQMTLVQQTSAQAAAQALASQQGIQTSGVRSTTINGNRAATLEGASVRAAGDGAVRRHLHRVRRQRLSAARHRAAAIVFPLRQRDAAERAELPPPDGLALPQPRAYARRRHAALTERLNPIAHLGPDASRGRDRRGRRDHERGEPDRPDPEWDDGQAAQVRRRLRIGLVGRRDDGCLAPDGHLAVAVRVQFDADVPMRLHLLRDAHFDRYLFTDRNRPEELGAERDGDGARTRKVAAENLGGEAKHVDPVDDGAAKPALSPGLLVDVDRVVVARHVRERADVFYGERARPLKRVADGEGVVGMSHQGERKRARRSGVGMRQASR